MSNTGHDDDAGEAHAPTPEPAPAAVARDHHRPWRKWFIMTLLVLIGVPAVGLTLWAGVALHYTYASGERAGYVQKFSRKGWLCKTWEGELAMVNVPGAMQERWQFTVRDDSVAQQILHDMGGRVKLDYQQHKGVPTSCFGETEYYVIGVQTVPAP
jgi:hypothetical protein